MVDSNDIETRIDDLRQTYGEFPVEVGEYRLTTSTYERAWELQENGIPGASRVWVERADEVLLVREESRPESWDVAGGLIKPDESATQAGGREVREETGIVCDIIDVAYVHRA